MVYEIEDTIIPLFDFQKKIKVKVTVKKNGDVDLNIGPRGFSWNKKGKLIGAGCTIGTYRMREL